MGGGKVKHKPLPNSPPRLPFEQHSRFPPMTAWDIMSTVQGMPDRIRGSYQDTFVKYF